MMLAHVSNLYILDMTTKSEPVSWDHTWRRMVYGNGYITEILSGLGYIEPIMWSISNDCYVTVNGGWSVANNGRDISDGQAVTSIIDSLYHWNNKYQKIYENMTIHNFQY